MASAPARCFDLAGGCNFRDLGGYATRDGGRVRTGILFRSGVLTYLTAQDHAALAPLGIRTIVDLRRDDEIAAEPTTWAAPVRQLSWQLDESIASSQRGAPWEHAASGEAMRAWLTGSYPSMADWMTRAVRGLLDAVIDGATPLVFHCAAGKDRTGFCAAILLGLAGVDEATILADYALTDRAVDLFAFTRQHRNAGLGLTDGQHPFEKMAPDVREALMRADPAYLKAALDSIRARHGSIEGYAQGVLGLAPDRITALRERMIED